MISLIVLNELERTDLSLKEIRLLRLVQLHPGIEINPLRECAGYPGSTTGRLLRNLHLHGWVRFEHSDTDGRIRFCHLTETGEALGKTLKHLIHPQTPNQRINDALERSLTLPPLTAQSS
jgi:DNA-binding MarR family transcriptional regulator